MTLKIRIRPESHTENDLIYDVKKDFGIESIKLNLMGNKGWPDRMFLLPGKPAFIEFKRKGSIPYRLQEYRIRKMRELGYDVIWTANYEKAYRWIAALHAARVSEASHTTDDKPRSRRTAS